jgi:hypothetical protein
LDDKDSSNSYSISAISCCKLGGNRTGLIISAGSNKGVKVWQVSEENDKSVNGKHKVTLLKMSSNIGVVSQIEDENDDDSDEESEVKVVSKSNEAPAAKESSKCSIQ